MDALSIVIVIALILTIIILFTGIASMLTGGEFDKRHGTQLMMARVIMQGITLVLLLIAFYLANI